MHPRSRAARARAHRVGVRADVPAALGGLRARHRGRPAPRAVDREDPRRDRMATVARPRPHPRRRHRPHAPRARGRTRLSARHRHRGRGFIGSHVADAFLARGDDVVVVDDLSTGEKTNVPDGAAFEQLDIADAELARRRIRRRRRHRLPSRGAGKRHRLGRRSDPRLHVQRAGDAERLRGGAQTGRAGRVRVDGWSALRGRRAAADARELRAGAALAVRRVEARRRGVRRDVGPPLRPAERRASPGKCLRAAPEPARRGRRRRDLRRSPPARRAAAASR